MNPFYRRSLNERLVTVYVASLLLALAIFALLAVVIIDRTMRNSLDARLESIASGSAIFVDVARRRIQVDADDRRQFLALLGVDVSGEILDTRGAIKLSTVAKPPPGISSIARAATAPVSRSLGAGQQALRAYAIPLQAGRTRVGTVVVWRADDWIEEFDRDAALAFLLGALAIATVSWFVGNAVTRRALNEAFARQRRFTADASHELRAPLAVIRAEADLALRKDREPAEYRSSLQTVAEEADRLETLVEDLLASARADAPVARTRVAALDETTQRVAMRLTSLAKQRGVTLDADARSGATLRVDPDALERALLAIVHNAIKFTPAGGTVRIRTVRDESRARVSVGDGGPGFSREALEHSTERFWREVSPHGERGSGLGLAIARSVVLAAHGTMVVENGPAGGMVRLAFTLA